MLQMSREEYGRFLGYSVAILTQNLLYSRNDNMAPSLSQQVLSHVSRLGQVIREHIRQPELDPALKRETALLFLTIYRWNWDPEDLNLAIDMTRNEQSDNSFPIYVRTLHHRDNAGLDGKHKVFSGPSVATGILSWTCADCVESLFISKAE